MQVSCTSDRLCAALVQETQALFRIDDIEDDAQLRRGVPGRRLRYELSVRNLIKHPASHKIYGIPQTINSANYAYFLAYQQLFALRNDMQTQADSTDRPKRLINDTELDKIVTGLCLRMSEKQRIIDYHKEELVSLHRGQGLELLWRDSLQCPTEEQYISMVNNSMSPLISVA